jgi:hypothetical protein
MSRGERRRRGSSLLELMLASAVLAIGLTGVSILLVQGASVSTAGSREFEATTFGLSRLNTLASSPYGSLTPGTFDGGAVFKNGVAIVSSTMTVQTLASLAAASADGGVSGSVAGAAWPGYRLSVRVQWKNSLLQNRSMTYTTVVTEPFDGGL